MQNRIKELRRARGLRQEDMAVLLGVSRQTIVAMENDKYDPTLELARKTARLLCAPVEQLFFCATAHNARCSLHILGV